jgi:predicted amidophosphoribosyltransferase
MGVRDLLAPSRCLSCAARAVPPWCAACGADAARLVIDAACDRCGMPRHDDGTDHRCWPVETPILATAVAYRYTGVVAATVATSKARHAWDGWDRLGTDVAAAVRRAGIVGVDAVTWVPADRRRARRRGADHAALLAYPVAAAVGQPLVRLLDAAPRRRDQAMLPTGARRALKPGAFVARRRLDGARVLLVDDVLTTGATARVAAGALADAGAAPVRLAVLARAGGHGLDAPAS